MPHISSHLALLPSYDGVIPSFQRSHVVAVAVQSVLGQTQKATRIIVIDDGSMDDTERVLEALGHKNPIVVLLFLAHNVGASAAHKARVAACRSEWIAFLDSDDLWVKDAAADLLGAAVQGLLDVAVGLFYRVGRDGVTGTHADAPTAINFLRRAFGFTERVV